MGEPRDPGDVGRPAVRRPGDHIQRRPDPDSMRKDNRHVLVTLDDRFYQDKSSRQTMNVRLSRDESWNVRLEPGSIRLPK
jgi:hypothetical protein